MWIDGKNYKSLNFTVLKEKLLDGTKTQTFRTKFIPNYECGETVAITFNHEFLFFAIIEDVYPKRISELCHTEGIRDGFSNREEMQKKIMDLNNIKSKQHWGFITVFKKIKRGEG